MNIARVVVLLSVVSMVAACAGLEGTKAPAGPEASSPKRAPSEAAIPESAEDESSSWPVTRPRQPLDDLDSLLRYFQRIKKLSGTELVREHEEARRTYAAAPSEYNRVRLAMLLSLPNTAFRNEAHALELLDPTVKNRTEGIYGLAFLLTSYIQEHRKLDGNIQSLQQNVQDLQHKLDALKSLERSMSERDHSGVKKR